MRKSVRKHCDWMNQRVICVCVYFHPFSQSFSFVLSLQSSEQCDFGKCKFSIWYDAVWCGAYLWCIYWKTNIQNYLKSERHWIACLYVLVCTSYYLLNVLCIFNVQSCYFISYKTYRWVVVRRTHTRTPNHRCERCVCDVCAGIWSENLRIYFPYFCILCVRPMKFVWFR